MPGVLGTEGYRFESCRVYFFKALLIRAFFILACPLTRKNPLLVEMGHFGVSQVDLGQFAKH